MTVEMHRGHLILVVEDDRDISEGLRDALTGEGYEVVTAYNGKEALDRLRGIDRPCLILLDLMMPVMSGAEFRVAQRQDRALAGVPVALISAAEHLRDMAPALDAAAYVPKPIDFGALLATIERFCGKSRAQGA